MNCSKLYIAIATFLLLLALHFTLSLSDHSWSMYQNLVSQAKLAHSIAIDSTRKPIDNHPESSLLKVWKLESNQSCRLVRPNNEIFKFTKYATSFRLPSSADIAKCVTRYTIFTTNNIVWNSSESYGLRIFFGTCALQSMTHLGGPC